MTYRRSPWNLTLILSAALACGDSDGKTSGDSSTTAATTTATTATTAATDDSTATTVEPTTGSTTSTTTSTTGTTSQTSSTGEPTTTGTSTATDTAADTGTTAADLSFERFRLARAAGPCPPNSDCDGFVELLASRTLRLEKFGEIGNPVSEAEISEQDLAAAALVFTDPALIALLDSPEPLCNPPTDIFEGMELEVDGVLHDATTTTCDQAPLVAARDMANMLVQTYLP